jgi:metal-dependent hydrolase (beta-lactamase superfamily II)
MIDMHMHVDHIGGMRTTVEISDSQRAKLLKLAAERGEKGFSRLVGEALERFLADEGSRKDRIRNALALEGTLDKKAADEMEASVRRIRSTWR